MAIKRTRRFLPAVHFLLAAGALGLATAPVRGARPLPSDYAVRSMAVESKNAPGHGRLYAILSVQTVSSDPQSMPPVDEDTLIAEVCQSLDGHGFRPVSKGQTPEILITVHYGRAWLRNPYLNGTGDSQAIEGLRLCRPFGGRRRM